MLHIDVAKDACRFNLLRIHISIRHCLPTKYSKIDIKLTAVINSNWSLHFLVENRQSRPRADQRQKIFSPQLRQHFTYVRNLTPLNLRPQPNTLRSQQEWLRDLKMRKIGFLRLTQKQSRSLRFTRRLKSRTKIHAITRVKIFWGPRWLRGLHSDVFENFVNRNFPIS